MLCVSLTAIVSFTKILLLALNLARVTFARLVHSALVGPTAERNDAV
jgi:hypothetical protein